MPIRVHIHEERYLRVNTILGVVTPAHFEALAGFCTKRRDLLAHDLISLVDPDVIVAGFGASDLAELRQMYRALQLNADFMMQRRSAWICPSVAAWPILEAWLDGRHARDGQGTEFCLVARLEEASVLFEPEELEAVRAWRDFRDLALIDA